MLVLFYMYLAIILATTCKRACWEGTCVMTPSMPRASIIMDNFVPDKLLQKSQKVEY